MPKHSRHISHFFYSPTLRHSSSYGDKALESDMQNPGMSEVQAVGYPSHFVFPP